MESKTFQEFTAPSNTTSVSLTKSPNVWPMTSTKIITTSNIVTAGSRMKLKRLTLTLKCDEKELLNSTKNHFVKK